MLFKQTRLVADRSVASVLSLVHARRSLFSLQHQPHRSSWLTALESQPTTAPRSFNLTTATAVLVSTRAYTSSSSPKRYSAVQGSGSGPKVSDHTSTELEAMTNFQLRGMLKEYGLMVSGRKAELVDRLLKHFHQHHAQNHRADVANGSTKNQGNAIKAAEVGEVKPEQQRRLFEERQQWDHLASPLPAQTTSANAATTVRSTSKTNGTNAGEPSAKPLDKEQSTKTAHDRDQLKAQREKEQHDRELKAKQEKEIHERELKAKLEKERLAKEKHEKEQQELQAKQEKERLAKEKHEKEQRELKVKQEKEQHERELKAKQENERLAKEKYEKEQQELKARQEKEQREIKAKEERERIAREKQEKERRDLKAKEEKEQHERESKARHEKEQQELKAKLEKERLAKEKHEKEQRELKARQEREQHERDLWAKQEKERHEKELKAKHDSELKAKQEKERHELELKAKYDKEVQEKERHLKAVALAAEQQALRAKKVTDEKLKEAAKRAEKEHVSNSGSASSSDKESHGDKWTEEKIPIGTKAVGVVLGLGIVAWFLSGKRDRWVEAQAKAAEERRQRLAEETAEEVQKAELKAQEKDKSHNDINRLS